VVGAARSLERCQCFAGGVEPAIVDVFDEASLLEIVRKAEPDIVIHQLTELPPRSTLRRCRSESAMRASVIGTRSLAPLQRNVRRWLPKHCVRPAPGPMPYRGRTPESDDLISV
jgi:dTDP-4-dehydrorhamnose reductase